MTKTASTMYSDGQEGPNLSQDDYAKLKSNALPYKDNQLGDISRDPQSMYHGNPTFLTDVPTSDEYDPHPSFNINTPHYQHGEEHGMPGPVEYLRNPLDATGTVFQDTHFTGNGGQTRTASASFASIISMSRHKKNRKVRLASYDVQVHKFSAPDEESKGLYLFSAKDMRATEEAEKKGGTHGPHTVAVQFLQDESGEAVAPDLHKVMVGCSCPYFINYGPVYYAEKGQYLYREMVRKPDSSSKFLMNYPSPRQKDDSEFGYMNREKGMTYCKHLYAVYQRIHDAKLATQASGESNPNLQSTMGKIITVDDSGLYGPNMDVGKWKKFHHMETEEEFERFCRGVFSSGRVPRFLLPEFRTEARKGDQSRSLSSYAHDLAAWMSAGGAGIPYARQVLKRFSQVNSKAPTYLLGIYFWALSFQEEQPGATFSVEVFKDIYSHLSDMLEKMHPALDSDETVNSGALNANV